MKKSNLQIGAARKQKSSIDPSKTPDKGIAVVAEGGAKTAVGAKQVARKLRSGIKITNSGGSGFVIRDSFTMPVADYELIGVLKQRCLGLGTAVKKSELLRAGLATLHRLTDENLTQMVSAIENVKTGRPPGRKKKNVAEDSKQ